MLGFPKDEFHVGGGYASLIREAGLDAEAVYSHPAVRVWRSVAERENATLDLQADGKPVRLHLKRFHATKGSPTPAEQEVAGIRLLQHAGIATVPLVAWGRRTDGRSFVITQDLTHFLPADRALKDAPTAPTAPRDAILRETAALAAKLHAALLHHRDLYLCHFFVGTSAVGLDVRLIDAARVRPLPPWPLRRRWIVKDLAQWWYSMDQAGVSHGERAAAWDAYVSQSKSPWPHWLRRSVAAKARRIARHDANLKRRRPERDVSLSH